jgi:hypothetical protein
MPPSFLKTLDAVIGALLVAAGTVVVVLSEKLSAWEKRLKEAQPWTRVTGWSGTRKGVIAWRFAGALLILLGILFEYRVLFSR